MNQVSRRSFLQKLGIGIGATTAVTALPLFADHALTENKKYTGKKLNVALCGLGNYANILAEGLAVSQYCRLAGIVTGTPAKAALWMKKYNLPAANIYNYQDFDHIINNKDIDLVYVVLPNSMHKEFTIRAARAGKHVITEKPMALSAGDCEEMIKACVAANVQLAVGYRLHYEPYNMEIKRLGQEKVFGPVRLMETSLGYKVDNNKEWRLHKALSGGGPLMNLGVYCLQASRYIMGEEPVAVTAQFNPAVNKEIFAEVEASITWQLDFPSGAICNSTSTYTANIDRLFAAAENGFFELAPAISYGPFKGRTSNGELHFPANNQQAAQMDGIGKLLLENKTLPAHISGEEGLKDMKIIGAIYEAARTGSKISLV
ncbi:MAG: Gfo/Idh/MocA family oxidoreductase [Chitinophagaceae bacterium]